MQKRHAPPRFGIGAFDVESFAQRSAEVATRVRSRFCALQS